MNDQETVADRELRRAWAAANAADAAADARDTSPSPRGPADRDESAWVAPGWATGLALFLIPVAMIFGGLSPMATDSCGPDHCSAALDHALAAIIGCLYATLSVTPAALLTSWLLPRRMRYSTARRIVAWCALLPPVLVILMVFTLPEG
ncbi:hypothetical protein [Streptomyces syringium]|uniref:Uncharacterized protein n=1 Tax=Streptomyces syringium TaxID=76729 RepID=A0ABS4XYW7_9ACTN|nr:hypothetical protein [Streptomyces syringium]MBP2400903.1 hypothetical protein [Streptomyces syringium]